MNDSITAIIEGDIERIISFIDLNEIENKSILITGASGLLGVYLLACLKKISSLGRPPTSVTAVIHSQLTQPLKNFVNFDQANVVRGDLTNPVFLRSLDKYDYIIHAAGYGQPGRFMEDPIKTLKLNTLTTFGLFDCLKVGGRFLFLSSSEIYSGNLNPPYRESHIGQTNPDHFRSCYIEGKRGGEAICNGYRGLGMKAYSARLALAYGPGTRPADRRVINSFIERGLRHKKIILQDMGEAKRTYCYISDAIEILWSILLKGEKPVYNVGGFSRTTIGELANKIGDYLGVPVEYPASFDRAEGAPEDVSLDMSLTKEEFGKTDYIDLNIGLRNTIEWQKSMYSSELFGNMG